MKIVTFNIRCALSGDGINSFFHRAGGILWKIDNEKPDVIGFQEVRPEIYDFLCKHLTGYTVVGCGRGADYEGEHNPVAFRSDKFELIGLDTEWLSPTPYIPGSRYAEQSDCPRICTRVTLRRFGSARPFDIYNTHLDHISEQARVLGAQAVCGIMAARKAKWNLPMMLMGDMNDYPTSGPIRTFLADKLLALTEHTTGVGTTWHDYGKAHHERIDYIMSNGFTQKGDIELWTDEQDGIWLSDHYPLAVELDME